MKVIVCGGRFFDDRRALAAYMDRLNLLRPITEIAEGGAWGADRMAKRWAVSRGIPVRTFAARWIDDGPSAGAIRNAEMLEKFEPQCVIAFPGGNGTRNMVMQAERRGVLVLTASAGADEWVGL
jgi:hypothetical protein